ncbi:MAG: cytochrome c3 family protein [Desulfovibrio sp.]|jgi:hypothetical protein|nr:cytochrome c3 family protein [Desulfovibrio sp.]
MKKMSFALLCLFLFAAAMQALAAAPPVPTEPLALKGSKKEVMFPHAPHKDKVECVTCHHNVDGKENYQKCATAGCHDNLTEKKGEKSLYVVIHSKEKLKHRTCFECHTNVVAEKAELKKDLLGCAKSKCHP